LYAVNGPAQFDFVKPTCTRDVLDLPVTSSTSLPLPIPLPHFQEATERGEGVEVEGARQT